MHTPRKFPTPCYGHVEKKRKKKKGEARNVKKGKEASTNYEINRRKTTVKKKNRNGQRPSFID